MDTIHSCVGCTQENAIFLMVWITGLLCGCSPVGEPISEKLFPANSGRVFQDAGFYQFDCEQSALLDDTVALYCFEDELLDEVVDSKKEHHGQLRGTKVRLVKGPSCCGSAIFFSETNASSYIVVPDSDDFDLEQGSVSFWIRVTDCPQSGMGILSRDARLSDEAGHFGVRIFSDCDLSARLQADAKDNADDVEVYSKEPLVPGVWTYVIINFGPPFLEILFDNRLVGQRSIDWGIAGNDNPWLIGADARYSEQGTGIPPSDFLQGVALDLIRISSERLRPEIVQ